MGCLNSKSSVKKSKLSENDSASEELVPSLDLAEVTVHSGEEFVDESDPKHLMNILRNQQLFKNCKDSQLAPLLKHILVKSLESGETIIQKGDESTSIYILCSGSVDVMSENAGGGRILEINENQIFGEFGFIHQLPRQVAIVTNKPCTLLEFTRENYDEIKSLKAMAKFVQWVETAVHEILADSLQQLQFLASTEDRATVKKIAAYLVPKRVHRGDVIVEEGADYGAFYVVVRGELLVHTTDSNGFPVELKRLQQGDIFGEESLLGNSKSHSNITSVAEGVLYRLTKEAFSKVANQLPAHKDITRALKQRKKTGKAMLTIPFLQHLPSYKVEQLNKSCSMYRHAPSEVILKQNGSWPQKFFMIIQGSVNIEVDSEVIRSLGPGEYFGEVSLVGDQPHTASVRVSTESEVFCLECDRATFNAVFSDIPAVTAEIEMRIYGKQCTLSQVLQMPSARALFSTHCEKEFAKENIDFWLSVEKFRKLAKDRTDVKTLETIHMNVADIQTKRKWVMEVSAKSLYSTFVAQDSQTPINVKDQTVRDIQQRIDNEDFAVDMFDAAQREVFNLMERDNFGRFKDSSEFESLIEGIAPYSHATLTRKK